MQHAASLHVFVGQDDVRRYRGAVIAMLTAAGVWTSWGAATSRAASADEPFARASVCELLAQVASDDALKAQRERLIAAARNDAKKPVLRRPRNLPELAAWRVPLKYKVRPPHKNQLADAEWETFCLGQGDAGAGALLASELPRMAAAAALTQDDALVARILDQLEELATWSPLERRGWSLGNGKLTMSGDDGAWLGTGFLVRAIVDTLETLPVEKVPSVLRAALENRLAVELDLMEHDWATKRTWYARVEAAFSNQWILPSEAMVRACLFLGREQHRETYELGVSNLLRSMDAQGADGEFVEGLRYSGLSVESLFSIARATARVGDNRLVRHPFLRKFPTWVVHHFQPGGYIINAFDATVTARGNLSGDRGVLATAAYVMGDRHALWALQTRAGFGQTLEAVFAGRLPREMAAEPPLHAVYTKAARLNWRSSWDDDAATGLWLRGGHETDSHDHMDRGHVNFIIGRRALLIEAGHLNYGIPTYATHLRSVAGHNVLQVGPARADQLTSETLDHAGQILDLEHRAAPIIVERMDGNGGAARVDLSRCYKSVAKWQRRVAWNAHQVTIEDDVELKQPDIVQFRWHFGVRADARHSFAPGIIEADDIVLTYRGDQELAARVDPMPDATEVTGKISEHACAVVRSKEVVQRLQMTTRVGLKAQAAPGAAQWPGTP